MKFGKDLALNMVKNWEANYIAYERLKLVLAKGTSEEVKAEFRTATEEELAKVAAFYLAQVAELEQKIESRHNRVALADPSAVAADAYEASDTHYEIFRELSNLKTFVWINAEGFRKIMKKFDKVMGLRGGDAQEAPAFEDRLAEMPFMDDSVQKMLDSLKTDKQWDFKIVSGTGNLPLSEEICGRAGVPLTPLLVKKFADGELFVQVMENVRGADVYLVQPTCQPVNDHLMELLLTVGALRRASASRITAVIPYYGYARQDRKDRPRVTISAADVARMIESMGVDRVVCVDLHCGQIQGFFGPRTPVDNLYAGPIALQYFKYKKLNNPVVVSPDAGGVYRAKTFKEGLEALGVDAALAMIIKQRKQAGVIGTMDLVGHVKGCDCIIVDDMIDTAGTLCTAANELKMMGAAKVFAFATHGLFNGPALQRIEASALDEVVCANTVPLREGTHDVTSKIKQLSIGKLLAATIQRLHTGESVGELFHDPAKLFASAPIKGGPQKPGVARTQSSQSLDKAAAAAAAEAAGPAKTD